MPIMTQAQNDTYASGWDRIWGSVQPEPEPEGEWLQTLDGTPYFEAETKHDCL